MLHHLVQADVQQAIHQAMLQPDVLRRSMQLRQQWPAEQAAWMATQAVLKLRIQAKLPDWAVPGTVLPPESAEQASSALAASLKPWGSGQLAIDLTCGLGADAQAMSRHYARVLAIEADPARAETARHNLAVLGCTNIEVVHADASQWWAAYTGPRPNLLYLDPARRAAGARLHAMQQLLPNPEPFIKSVVEGRAGRVLLKLSPLHDVAAVLALPGIHSCVITSINGEVKETLADTDPLVAIAGQGLLVQLHRRGRLHSYSSAWPVQAQPAAVWPTVPPQYLYLTDAAITKARLHPQTLGTELYCATQDVWLPGSGVLLSPRPMAHFPGSGWQVLHWLPPHGPALARQLKALHLHQADVAAPGLPASAVAAAGKLKPGGGALLVLLPQGSAWCAPLV